MKNYRPLTTEEVRIIQNKGTEPPFSGRFSIPQEGGGLYVCRQCGAALYHAQDQFVSGCGWPSFDAGIPDAVQRVPDEDGRRMEILCARCDAHLGHIFLEEGFTPRNVRHCVNSVSMDFIPAADMAGVVVDPTRERKAYFAGGCFWGLEYYMRRATGVRGVRAGYLGGYKENPTYEEVCTGQTGHAEVVEVTFDPREVSFESLVKIFFEIHDFTQMNRQGPDEGTQYRSEIMIVDEDQRKTVQKVISQMGTNNIATQTSWATRFWPAEEYHQNYYQKTGGTPYCHHHHHIFNPAETTSD